MSIEALAQLHFLRPLWLLALLLMPVLLLWRARQQRASDPWRAVVDAPLLAAQSEGRARTARLPDLLLALGCSIAILALAGPAFRQEPAPTLRLQAPLVLALDLSPAMRAADLKPDRLTRARLKLAELVRRREDGQTALIAFSSEAFTVAPLTEDAATLDGLLAALDPSVLPIAGQRPARALQSAQRLISEASASSDARGEVLLVTDHADAAAIDAAAKLAAAGIRVSVLGVGTAEGAPVPAAGGGFLLDAQGNIRLPRLDEPSLRELAAAGGGRYTRLSADDRDLRALQLDQITAAGQAIEAGTGERLRYRDEGPLLLLVLLPLAALAARRGWLLSLFLVLPLAGTPSAHAQTTAPLTLSAFAPAAPGSTLTASTAPGAGAPAGEVGGLRQFWNDLWQRRDRQAWDALQADAPDRAARLARDPALQGAAAYRAGDYERALSALEEVEGADAAYNRGNALAKLQRFEDALDAYDAALAAEPDHADAIANRAAVEAWLKQQQQQQQNGDPQQGDQQQDGEQGEQQGEPSEDGSQSQQQRQSTQDASQQEESQQDSGPSPSDAQQGDPRDESQPASDSGDEAPPSEQQPSADAQQQAAYNEAMQQALQQAAEQGQEPAQAAELSAEEMAEAERQQALQQLLRRVPDDPGGLLRRKFLLEYQRRQREGDP